MQERFSAALDFFRQEQHGKTKHPVSLDALRTRSMQTVSCVTCICLAANIKCLKDFFFEKNQNWF